MRTTIRLDDALLERAKRLASERGQTLTDLFEASLREKLARLEGAERGSEPRKPVALPTYKGRGVRPGIDLHDGAALLDAMERRGGTDEGEC